MNATIIALLLVDSTNSLLGNQFRVHHDISSVPLVPSVVPSR